MKFFSIKKYAKEAQVTILGNKFSIKYDYEKQVAQNYAKKLKNLQNIYGKQKIRVGFLVTEQAKWQYESLYQELEKSPFFEPVVLVSQLVGSHKGTKNFYKTIDECYDFFFKQGLNVRYAYDRIKKKYISVKNLGVDIIFYQQPWEVYKTHSPLVVSKYALTCYVAYGMHLVDFDESYTTDFHQFLYLMFIENEELIESFSKIINMTVSNCVATGYAKLDAYFLSDNKENKSDKPLVIYAPHHSFEKNGLNCATFQKNGIDILKLAKKYKNQIDWVFKPHPRFKSAVISNRIMSEKEINDYYEEWEAIGTIYDSGNYFGLFRQSAGMITDSISFLGEYLPTGKPLFHLLGEKRPFNDFAKLFIDTFYQIEEYHELEDIFHKVIMEKQDEKYDERNSKISVLFDSKEKSATKIMNKLTSLMQK